MAPAPSQSADSARLVPVTKRITKRITCLVVSEEAISLLARFPTQAQALGRLWSQTPTSALSVLGAAAWDTALTSGFLLDPPQIEAAVACLLVQDVDGYEKALFHSSGTPTPGKFVDDGADTHPQLVGDALIDNYRSKLADIRKKLATASGDEATNLSATYAHRLLKLRQRRRELLQPRPDDAAIDGLDSDDFDDE